LNGFHGVKVLADKAYAGQKLLSQLKSQSCQAVIPCKRNCRRPWKIDGHEYKERHLIENFFNKIKEFRRISTRYDKLKDVYSVWVCFASLLIWLR